jgi:ubiquinone/menaquinone biosynthesis C-methylase UbiE
MPARSRRKAAKSGQFGPESYRFWRATSLGDITEALERALLLRLVGPLDRRNVLDVGCGDGVLTRTFAEASASRVVGIDIDERMISRASARAAERGVPIDIDYVIGQAQNLPFRGGSLDLVTVVTVLTFVPEPLVAMREMARVLRPGGRLVVGELGKWSQWAAERRIRGWRKGGMWRDATFRSAGEWRVLVEAAGFDVEQVTGAIYYPRSTGIARLMAPFDPLLGNLTTFGAAFLGVLARKR